MSTWYTQTFTNVYTDASCTNAAVLQYNTSSSSANSNIQAVYIYPNLATNVLDVSGIVYTNPSNSTYVTDNKWAGNIGPSGTTNNFFTKSAHPGSPSGIHLTTNLYYNNLTTKVPVNILYSRSDGLNRTTAIGQPGTYVVTTTSTVVTGQTCFNEDTKILCVDHESGNEMYRPVQELQVGDLVKTYKHGNRKIKLVGKGKLLNKSDNRWQDSMFKLNKTEDNGLTEDLIVTGWHSVLVDELTDDMLAKYNKCCFRHAMIDDKCLLVAGLSDKFTKIEDEQVFTYYHFVLENDGDMLKRYGVWANGILTETLIEECYNKKYNNN